MLGVFELVASTRAGLLELAGDAGNMAPERYPELQEGLQTAIAAYPAFDASTRRFWLGDIEWELWMRPVINWLVLFFLTYLIFMAFNVLIFRQWAHHEKLIYPFSELVLAATDDSAPERKQKSIFTSALFWIGFTLSASVLGWNYLATNNIIPNITPIKLTTLWRDYVGQGPLKGLASTHFCIIFAVIGVSFMVPANVSFSIWFFEILYMGFILVLAWYGYGENRWDMQNIGRAGMSSGAMLVFGISILWVCRRYLFCLFYPSTLKELPTGEAKELRLSSAIFVFGSLLLMLLLIFRLGANPFFVLVFYIITVTGVIALIRSAAEAGILSVRSYWSSFNIIRVLFGMNRAWCAPALVAPLIIFNTALMMQQGFRLIIAPMMANALKLREEFRMRRLHFHGAVWASIFVATAVALVTLITISYDRGGNNLFGWVHRSVPFQAFNSIRSWMEDSSTPKTPDRLWIVIGVVLMIVLLYGRQRVFWMPHPIGLVMLINPDMLGFWGSILIGWIFKSIVSKYCNHDQYLSIRRFFIGLVFGHLVAALLGWDGFRFAWN